MTILFSKTTLNSVKRTPPPCEHCRSSIQALTGQGVTLKTASWFVTFKNPEGTEGHLLRAKETSNHIGQNLQQIVDALKAVPYFFVDEARKLAKRSSKKA